MIDAARLLSELQGQQKKLEADLRQQIDSLEEVRATLETDYQDARKDNRTGDSFTVWCQGEITQAAVAWLLATVFLRFCEDNGLIPAPLLAGPGEANRRAQDAARDYFREHPTDNDRHYLKHAFAALAQYPAVAGLYAPAHNPLFRLPLSADAAAALLAYWRQVDPDSGALLRDFTDPQLDTRFLGDLYQDLSEAARKRYALLQTPLFVEEFILDRTLDPAIQTFGLEQLRLIDPTCGSGHFLLGAFARINALYEKQGVEPRERVKRALAAVHGVDLNPFAVAIARFRLLIVALQATGIRTLKEAPGWRFNVTAGDSLLHGRRFGELDLGSDRIEDRYRHCFFAEDRDEIDRILGQQYHAIVGNPPYITVKDKALNALYRQRYQSCHMKYSLGVPFTERFVQLAVSDERQPAGYVGLITTNSFMKREFGKKLIEDYLPRQDLTHVIDTSGAYIPGHGTPTVILFARHRAPIGDSLRAVLGIHGEPGTPGDPAMGLVWISIVELLDRPGSQNEFVSVSDMARETLARHPWSLSGGGATDVLTVLNGMPATLSELVTVVGVFGMTNADEVMLATRSVFRRVGIQSDFIRELTVGDEVRDWECEPSVSVLFPYVDDALMPLQSMPAIAKWLWPARTTLGNRATFAKLTYFAEGRAWWAWHQIALERLHPDLTITFAFVATHNHFVLDRGGKVFNRSAPVIKLSADADEATHLGLLGLLNSSTACFWMKQVSHNKGSTVDGKGARQTTVEFENFYEFTGTGMQKFPLPDSRPLQLATQLDQLAQARAAELPAALAARFPLSRDELNQARARAESLLGRMIAVQEELDWWCYHAYGLADEALCVSGAVPEIKLGERAFEIVMARQMAAGELQTSWFQRHGSEPSTELPVHWPAGYAARVQRRIALIESHPWVGLLEQPEYKRRWNQPGWDVLEQAALKTWLLDRLETAAYWPSPPALQTVDALSTCAERDADFMAVAELHAGQAGFALRPLLETLLNDESVPALKVLRYKESGLRKRAEWEHTWELQRLEDRIDAEVAQVQPREAGETEAEWAARLAPEQTRRKDEAVGQIPAPPKYSGADFISTGIKRLRGELDVPKERFFSLPQGASAGAVAGQSVYGWAGWNPVQRVTAIAAHYIDAESRQGWPVAQLLPLLAAVQEELPWVLQWHNRVDPEQGVRLGDYFKQWLGTELQKHNLTREDLTQWQPERVTRRRRTRQ